MMQNALKQQQIATKQGQNEADTTNEGYMPQNRGWVLGNVCQKNCRVGENNLFIVHLYLRWMTTYLVNEFNVFV